MRTPTPRDVIRDAACVTCHGSLNPSGFLIPAGVLLCHFAECVVSTQSELPDDRRSSSNEAFLRDMTKERCYESSTRLFKVEIRRLRSRVNDLVARAVDAPERVRVNIPLATG